MILLVQPLLQVSRLSCFTVFFGIFLDTTVSLKSTLEIIKQNPTLYFQGLKANYFNLLFLSPLYYVAAYNLLLNKMSSEFSFFKYVGLTLIHGVGYYQIHKLMHVNPKMRWIHDFHHKFVITTPTSGNAVSAYEFQLAYVLPFLVGALILQPSNLDFEYCILTISFLNLFIHTKELEYLKMPSFLVSPNDHIKHHKTKSDTYAAPLINFDNILSR
jgi:sterol desaturase/sphingolipid hydroxylase (fatty acid hydroxylase superfamily)